ncbi:hypothetical protein PFICI_14451 [Pestalotiopsis fici W106-1]|uniref:N-acetyltransferase ESCO zinc-finger domain-containing protein n=1 Tax=Pestalotiopsis fici (strain W106-1 / CGMCC3.15140) TaxID=1229662 RepID=W3WHU3_PESFW|nr:uncharacterized protein PFICI_14451 [Pestalotiopsis fici W106-1]ETS73505.1 hypothetical protein PFICI_14451 [Pestalotiopsis fici W106-1]
MTDHVAAGARGLNRPPLRTYSKRSAPNSTEPPAKKRRVESSNVDIHSIAGRFAQKLEAACQSKHDPQSQVPLPTPAQQPKKGTILSYFKVRSPSSTTSSSCAQVSEVIPLSSTPPSSIPSESNDSSCKKRRRLTTKPPLRNSDTSSPESDDDGSSDTKQQTQVTKDSKSTVQDVNGNLIDQDPRAKAERPDARERGTKKGSKSKKATVQTTLSLSLTEKQFIECNECNMLYNPYHEKDLKMHKKRHAAVMKANKAKGKDEACSH